MAVRSLSCGQPCRNIGYRIRLPSKRAIKAWEVLQVSLRERAIAEAEHRRLHRLRSIHRIEQEIARLQAMPVNEGRRKRIALLRRRLTEV